MQSFKKRDLMMPVLEHVATNDISSDAKAEAMLLNGDSLMENDVVSSKNEPYYFSKVPL